MIRFKDAAIFGLLGGLIVPGVAWSQDSPRDLNKPAERPRDPNVADPAVVLDPAVPRMPQRDQVVVDNPVAADAALKDVYKKYVTMGGAGSFDALQTNFGLTLAPVDDALRAQLEIPAGQGVVAVEVKPASLAEQAGLKPNDVILNLGAQRVMGVNQARGILLAIGKEAIEVKLIREGKPRRMSLVGPDHGFPPESSEFWIGVPVSPVDATLRSHLGDLPVEAGLIANDVVKGSPADRAGVKKNDILVSLGGKPLKIADDLIAQVQASKGQEVRLVLLRAGKITPVAVTPTRRAHPTVVTVNSARTNNPEVRYRVYEPKMAVETVQGWRYRDTFVASPKGEGPGKPGEKPIDLQIEVLSGRAKANVEEATARIEAQIKELSSKLEEVRRVLEGMRKPDPKGKPQDQSRLLDAAESRSQ